MTKRETLSPGFCVLSSPASLVFGSHRLTFSKPAGPPTEAPNVTCHYLSSSLSLQQAPPSPPPHSLLSHSPFPRPSIHTLLHAFFFFFRML
ncbi:uncharacterized protein DS421_2g55420 [Arachis hypogaea]|nr:uncharacterized protein DS421_2g55420 [Arachis hypogaea]